MMLLCGRWSRLRSSFHSRVFRKLITIKKGVFLMMRKILTALSLLLAATLFVAARPTSNLKAGAVYVMTNQTVNSVMAFARDNQTGALTLVDTELTGGAGNPIPIPPDPPTDPLASQGSLVLDD